MLEKLMTEKFFFFKSAETSFTFPYDSDIDVLSPKAVVKVLPMK